MKSEQVRSNILDNVTTRVLNFHQRRVTNAAPSVDDYDYVVRKELKKAVGELENKVVTAMSSGEGGESNPYEKATFGIAIDTQLIIGTDLAPHYIIAANQLTLKYGVAKLKVAATGQSVNFVLKKNGTEFYSDSVPAASTAVLVLDSLPAENFILHDIITVDITQTGTPDPGEGLIIVLKFEILDGGPL